MLVVVWTMLVDVLSQLSSANESLDFVAELETVFGLMAEVPVIFVVSSRYSLLGNLAQLPWPREFFSALDLHQDLNSGDREWSIVSE